MTKAQKADTGPVGRSVLRRETRAKLTGRAEYMHGFTTRGMLHGKILVE